MNAKKAKTLRRALRAAQIEPSAVEYKTDRRGHHGLTTSLAGNCGRRAYREMKRLAV